MNLLSFRISLFLCLALNLSGIFAQSPVVITATKNHLRARIETDSYVLDKTVVVHLTTE